MGADPFRRYVLQPGQQGARFGLPLGLPLAGDVESAEAEVAKVCLSWEA
jgi:hypothetical protein